LGEKLLTAEERVDFYSVPGRLVDLERRTPVRRCEENAVLLLIAAI
jgi:hypothetical protein